MALETKVLLLSLLQQVGMAKSLKDAYELIAMLAKADGVDVLSYEDFVEKYGTRDKAEGK